MRWHNRGGNGDDFALNRNFIREDTANGTVTAEVASRRDIGFQVRSQLRTHCAALESCAEFHRAVWILVEHVAKRKQSPSGALLRQERCHNIAFDSDQSVRTVITK